MNNKPVEETVTELSNRMTRIEQKLDMLILKFLNRDDLKQLNTTTLISSGD